MLLIFRLFTTAFRVDPHQFARIFLELGRVRENLWPLVSVARSANRQETSKIRRNINARGRSFHAGRGGGNYTGNEKLKL